MAGAATARIPTGNQPCLRSMYPCNPAVQGFAAEMWVPLLTCGCHSGHVGTTTRRRARSAPPSPPSACTFLTTRGHLKHDVTLCITGMYRNMGAVPVFKSEPICANFVDICCCRRYAGRGCLGPSPRQRAAPAVHGNQRALPSLRDDGRGAARPWSPPPPQTQNAELLASSASVVGRLTAKLQSAARKSQHDMPASATTEAALLTAASVNATYVTICPPAVLRGSRKSACHACLRDHRGGAAHGRLGKRKLCDQLVGQLLWSVKVSAHRLQLGGGQRLIDEHGTKLRLDRRRHLVAVGVRRCGVDMCGMDMCGSALFGL